jgi:hypothetical protein
MRKSFYLLIVCGIFAVCLFSSCKKEVKVSGIIVEPKSLYLSKGDVVQLSYMVSPYGADNKSVKWTSNDISVATVSETGLVTAISEGETQITTTTNDGHFTDMVAVTVERGSPAGDSIALIKLYEVARGLPVWDLTKPMNQWEGIVLNSNRRVVSIYQDIILISNPLDASIGNLTRLKRLALGINSYHHPVTNVTIPAEIGKLTDLQELYFYDEFTGTIPPELGNLTNLKSLNIYETSLTGSIPPELGNLTNLEKLYLTYNQLTGSIPSELGNLAKLEELNISVSLLTGSIPKELGNLTNLKMLVSVENQLTGNIPPELGNLINLKMLSLRENQLTGNIPPELGNLSKLEKLYLRDNQLIGAIPQELENLINLYDFNLRYNSLSGTIPQSLLDRFGYWSFCPQNGTNFDNLDCGW